jgi:hypothetical protein
VCHRAFPRSRAGYFFVGGFFGAVPVVVGAGVVVPVPPVSVVPVPVVPVPVEPPVVDPDALPGLPVLVPEPVVPVLVPEPVEPEPIVLDPEPEVGALPLGDESIEPEPGDVDEGLEVDSVVGEDVVDVSGVFAGSLLPPQARAPRTHVLRTR